MRPSPIRKRPARKKLTSRNIARQLGISDQRFSTYANGSRIPRQAFAETLARYFFKTDKERARFVAALHAIRSRIHDVGRRNTRSSLVERLARGEALRVSEFEMEPFAGKGMTIFLTRSSIVFFASAV